MLTSHKVNLEPLDPPKWDDHLVWKPPAEKQNIIDTLRSGIESYDRLEADEDVMRMVHRNKMVSALNSLEVP